MFERYRDYLSVAILNGIRRRTVHETPLTGWFLLQFPREKEHDKCPWIGRRGRLECQSPNFGNMWLVHLETFRLSHRFDILSFILKISPKAQYSNPPLNDIPVNHVGNVHIAPKELLP